MKLIVPLLAATLLLFENPSWSQKNKKADTTKADSKDPMQSSTFNGLAFRSIGPALTSVRIVDLAVDPKNNSEYYVASGSGGVWKTENAGITFPPIFDGQASFSIGCITIGS